MKSQDIADAIGVIQIAQMINSLSIAFIDAVKAGKDSVTEEELAASFAGKDEALAGLAAAIARAKAEGR